MSVMTPPQLSFTSQPLVRVGIDTVFTWPSAHATVVLLKCHGQTPPNTCQSRGLLISQPPHPPLLRQGATDGKVSMPPGRKRHGGSTKPVPPPSGVPSESRCHTLS